MLHMDLISPFNLVFYTFHPMLIQQGQGFYDKDGNVLICNANAVRAAKLMYDMINVDKIVYTKAGMRSPGFWTAVNEGVIVTVPGASWFTFGLKEQVSTQAGKWKVMPMPTFEKGKGHAPSIGGSTVVITSQTKSPKLAWDFVQFGFLTKEGQLAAYKGGGIFPCLLEALQDPIFDETDPYYGGQKVTRFFADLVKDVPLFYYMPTTREDWETVTKHLIGSLSNKTSVEDALNAAATQMVKGLKSVGIDSKIVR
ncbi:MAG: extracellular solute-binding protein [Thermoplasmata archaeon]|nr:extracellular solute-binding protein [Thermoplasmata archaeon]